MKKLVALAACVLSVILLWGVAGTVAQKKAKEAVVWPANEIKWLGAYGALIKLPAGMKNPLHSHSSDLKLIVLSGTFLYTPEDGTEQHLGPGSYLFEPEGTRHISGTGDDGPCEVFQESSGKFDFVPAEPPK